MLYVIFFLIEQIEVSYVVKRKTKHKFHYTIFQQAMILT